MFILQAAPEIHPFAKTGGLGDVVGGIVRPLAELGIETAAIMPLYRKVREGRPALARVAEFDVTVGEKTRTAVIWKGTFPGTQAAVYFVEEDSLFDREGLYGGLKGDYADNAERYIFFSRAVLDAIPALGLKVDVLHLHDWQTALIPVYLKTLYADSPAHSKIRSLLTIHNMGYQGVFWHWDWSLTGLDWSLFNWKQLEFWGKLNFLKGGLIFSDFLSTVSPRYAKEIQTEEFGCALEGVLRDRSKELVGILNGVDTAEWNPATDRQIPARYSAADLKGKAVCRAWLRKKLGLPDSAAPLFCVVSRLVEQKGVDLLAAVMGDFVASESQLVVLGTGEDALQRTLVGAARRWPSHVVVEIGFNTGLSHEVIAGADAVLMPSRYEPCGLTQLYGQLYGTVPVVRRTGGLADSVQDGVTGIVFGDATAASLTAAIRKTVDTWRKPAEWSRLMQNGMKQDWSWARSAREYAALYARLAGAGKPA